MRARNAWPPDAAADATEAIREALAILLEPGSVCELRAPNTRRATVSGYFSDLGKLTTAAAEWSGQAPGVYVTLNPVQADLMARSANRLSMYARHATADSDILRLRWLPLDFDPVRPSGISATDAEHEEALRRARECRDWLREQGWPEPVFADSGNGGHLLYRIDLPNDDASRRLLQRCLEAVALGFSDDDVTVDLKTFNAARIWKVYGTQAAKGDSTPERPHRKAKLLDVPAQPEVAPIELAERLAARAPETAAHSTSSADRRGGFDLERWIADHGLPVVRTGRWGDGGRKWLLSPCPWNSEHTDRAAYIVQFAGGAIAAGCHHNGCAGKDWPALRRLAEPGWQDRSVDVKGGLPGPRVDSRSEATVGSPVLVRLADVEPEEVAWLWPPYVPLGKLTIIQGDPEAGKSWLTLALATAVTTGAALPGGERREPASVVILTAEDGLADTVRPRLDAMGADVTGVIALTAVRGEDRDHPFSLANDLPALEAAVAEKRAVLVVIDPLSAYLGGHVDAWRDNDVRGILGPLAALAERHGVAIVGVVHLTKSPRARAIYRGQGSIAFPAAARSVLLVAELPDTPGLRVVAQVKCNLAPRGPSLGFTLEGGRFGWTGEVAVDADTLLLPRSAADGGPRHEAEGFLRETLAEAPRPAREVIQEAEVAGISEKTLRRAKDTLSIGAVRIGGLGREGEWVWALPGADNATKVATTPNIANLAILGRGESGEALEAEEVGHLSTGAESDPGARSYCWALAEERGFPSVKLRRGERVVGGPESWQKFVQRGRLEDVQRAIDALEEVSV